MTAQDKKKAAVAAALFGFLAIYWGYKIFSGPDKPPPPAASAAAPLRRAGKAGAPSPLAEPIRVNLALLKKRGEPYRAVRNIFNPIYKKPALVKPKKGPITVAPVLPPPPPPKSPAQIAAEGAKEEMNKIKVLGFLKRKSREDVFLSLGNDYYTAGKGENIVKGYYLKDVGKDYVVVADRDTNTEVRLSTNFEKGASTTVPSPGAGGGPPGGRPQGPRYYGLPAGMVPSGRERMGPVPGASPIPPVPNALPQGYSAPAAGPGRSYMPPGPAPRALPSPPPLSGHS